MSGIRVTARVRQNVPCRLAVSTSSLMTGPVYGPSVFPKGGCAKMKIDGLAVNTTYYCCVEIDGVLRTSPLGKFKTPPGVIGAAQTFKMAFSSCAQNGSNHVVFDRIRTEAPLFFVHLGDMHYADIATNTPTLFASNFDRVFLSARQNQLYREIPTLYMYDDHDYGPDDSHGSSSPRDAAVASFRRRVPTPDLALSGATDATYYSFEIGRVLFIVTDLRSMASPKGNTDNSSKTKMGTAQKAWFKNLLTNSAGKVVVWLSTSPFIPNTTAGADHWGGYNTERVELADHIKANCLGRIFILTGDTHAIGLDNGANGDFATGGGGAVREFTASPLDQTVGTWPATYSSGYIQNVGQFGMVEFIDTGASTVTINWTAMKSDGAVLATQSFTRTP